MVIFHNFAEKSLSFLLKIGLKQGEGLRTSTITEHSNPN